jgi:hypothetical protein
MDLEAAAASTDHDRGQRWKETTARGGMETAGGMSMQQKRVATILFE